MDTATINLREHGLLIAQKQRKRRILEISVFRILQTWIMERVNFVLAKARDGILIEISILGKNKKEIFPTIWYR